MGRDCSLRFSSLIIIVDAFYVIINAVRSLYIFNYNVYIYI
jgi:hypothetical protein